MDMEKLVALCRRRGFIFQSSEIYGGINGFWDYGPLGVELKKNIKDAWWQDMVRNPPPGPDGQEIEMVGVDCAIIMNPKVWEASGHVGGFQDPMVDCVETKSRFRTDQITIFALDLKYDSPDFEIVGPYFLAPVDDARATDDDLISFHKKAFEALRKQYVKPGMKAGLIRMPAKSVLNDPNERQKVVVP